MPTSGRKSRAICCARIAKRGTGQEGQLLFEIDPRPFRAALDQAQGQLAQARAQLANAEAVQRRTQLDVERYIPLAKEQQQDRESIGRWYRSILWPSRLTNRRAPRGTLPRSASTLRGGCIGVTSSINRGRRRR